MKTTLLALILVTFTFSITSCTRAGVNSSSKVTLLLPDGFTFSQSASQLLAEAITPNCYLLMATGPEAFMQRNRCEHYETGSPSAISQTMVGPWSGGMPSGSELSMEVSSGKDRTFYIAGFEAQAGECRDFRAGPPPENLNIFFLGKSLPVSLEPGKTVEVAITLNATPTTVVDNCRGPDFPGFGGGSGPASVPTKIVLQKQEFPANTFSTDQCVGVEAVLLDAADRNANAPANINFRLENDRSGTFDPVTIFTSMVNCNNTNGIANGYHVIPVGEERAYFYIRAITVSGGPIVSNYRISSTGLTSSVRPIETYGANYIGLDLILPKKILPGICYKAELLLRSLAPPHDPYPATVGGDVGFSITGASAYGTSTNCTSGTATPVTALNYPAVTSAAFVYIKMDTVPTTTELSLSGNSLPIGFSSVNIAGVKSRAFRGDGTAIPTRIELRGDTKIRGNPNVCYNRYYLATLVNNRGTAVPAPNGSFGVYRTQPSGPSALEPYDTPACSPNMIAEPTGAFSPFVLGSAQKKIFVKLPAFSSPGTYNLNLTPVLNGVAVPSPPLSYSIDYVGP